MPRNIDDILALADLGFRIHPLITKNKVPIIKAWQIKASTDPAMIRQWNSIHKDCNWGVATGGESGIFVVDLDIKAGGLKSWTKITKDKDLPETAVVLTGGGGKHLYYKYPKNVEIRNSASKVGKGIDIRGDGGQVVIPPSIHPNGTPYAWETPPNKIAKPPKWLLDLINDAQGEDEDTAIGDKMEKGTRNNQIYHQALFLARQGALQEVAVAAMITWCESTGEDDISEDEIRQTVDSAYKYHVREKYKSASTTEIELSDVGNAQRLLMASGSKIIYVPSIGWHIWDDKHWGYDIEDLDIKKAAVDAMEAMKLDIGEQIKSTTDRQKATVLFKMYNWAIGSHSAGKINSMVEVAKVFPQIVKSQDELDDANTTFLVNFNNGTLDMRDGKLTKHDPSQLITRLIRHNYNPKAKCPEWIGTLKLAFNENKNLINYFQRALGYSLSASLSEQCFFICWGEKGNNGKSTMLGAVERILGTDYAAMSDAAVISSKDKNNHVLSSLAALNKVRMVSINEIAENAVLDEELIKQLTGGDTLQAKFLYREPFTYKPSFKIWMRANNKPTVRGTGEAFWRRVKLIPFIESIPEEKRKNRDIIDAALHAEAEGILAWMVKGFQEWFKNGLQDPEEVKAAGVSYREQSDIVSQFMSECVETDSNQNTSRQELYGVFREWSRDQGLRYTMTQEKFSRRVSMITGQMDRIREGQVSVWINLELTSNAKANYSF